MKKFMTSGLTIEQFVVITLSTRMESDTLFEHFTAQGHAGIENSRQSVMSGRHRRIF